MAPVRICTRSSRLAVAQAELVSKALVETGLETEILKVNSAGDMDLTSPLFKIGGSGIFVEEINKRVLNSDCDVAVHSAKDLPSVLPEGLDILAVLPREEPNDVLISNIELHGLPPGSIIGTSSIRRIHELKMLRSDLKVEDLRGNLDTRIKKFKKGSYDGIILAKAGLKRMPVEVNFFDLNLDDFLPAPNQGIIAVVGKRESHFAESLARINHADSFEEMLVERKLMSELKLGCSLPAAVFCKKQDGIYRLRSRFYSQNSREFKEFTRTFSDMTEIESMANEIRMKVPSSYGFDFKTV